MSFLFIITASILGSLHCVGMCGGFATLISGGASPRRDMCLYHFGRLISYTILGAFAGLIGASLEKAGLLLGVQRGAAIVTGIFLIASSLFILFGSKLFKNAPSDPLVVIRNKISKVASPSMAGFGLGISTGFLPCGFLYIAVQKVLLFQHLWPASGLGPYLSFHYSVSSPDL